MGSLPHVMWFRIDKGLESVHYLNKNAFQWDAYHPFVDCIPACTAQGGVSASGQGAGGGCLPVVPGRYLPRRVSASGPGGVSQHAMGQTPAPCGQTDTCENITFRNFICRR